jgi:hypothetical protein
MATSQSPQRKCKLQKAGYLRHLFLASMVHILSHDAKQEQKNPIVVTNNKKVRKTPQFGIQFVAQFFSVCSMPADTNNRSSIFSNWILESLSILI